MARGPAGTHNVFMRTFSRIPLLVPFLLAGCELNYACVSINPFPIQVTVYDSATGMLLPAAKGVVIRLSSRTSLDGDTYALMPAGEAVLAAGGPSGRYAVQISHDGYATWDTTDIVVRDDGDPCHQLETVNLEARLARTDIP
jgi:hypothetical protein